MHYHWLCRSALILLNFLIPKLVVAFEEGFFSKDPISSFGLIFLFVLLSWQLIFFLYSDDAEKRNTFWILYKTQISSQKAKLLDTLPEPLIVCDQKEVVYINEKA
jgi:hypothetical protein